MIWQKNSYSESLLSELLLISVVFISITLPFDSNAAEVTRKHIKKTLFNIKQKYQTLAAQGSIQATKKATQPSVQEFYLPSPLPKNISNASYNSPNIDKLTEDARTAAVEYEGRFAVGEELILSITIGAIPLGDIFAIKSAEGVKVGLSEFFQLVEFAINVDIDNSNAEGWFIAQKNSFSLSPTNANTLQVKVNKRQFIVPASRFILDDDIYVELSDINTWFSVASNFDESALAIDLTTSIPFPIEKQLQRRRVQLTNNGGLTESVLPLKSSDYQLLSVPLLDMQLSTGRASSNTSSSYSILSSQDAGYFSSQIYLNGNDTDSLNSARLTLSRQSKQADLLGPLKMTEYAFGDVTPVNIGVGQTQALGRGFTMNNAAKRLVDNRRINLVGEVQIGWDVELYRNGILIANSTNVVEGRYEFNDVELNYGSNNFELVFYGAQGQIERRTESHFVDRNTLESGQGIMQLSVVDNNRSLFGVGDDESDPSQNGVSVSSVYNYGLTDWLSFGVGASILFPKQGQNEQGFSLRSNLALGSYGLFDSVFQFDDDDRRSMLHNYRTQIANTSWNIAYRQDELLSEELIQNQLITRSGSKSLSVRMSSTLFSGSSLPLNYENTWTKTESTNGSIINQLQNSVGINTRWGSFSHGLVWQRSEENNEANDARLTDYDAGGSLAYRTRLGRAFTRVFSSYQIKPEPELSSIGSSITYPFTNKINSEIRYTYNIVDNNDRYDLRLNWTGDTFTFSGIANYDIDGDWGINFTARFGLGYDKETNTLFSSGRSLGTAGAVVVRMFEDENLDQQYTEGEAVLNDVSVSAVQSFRQETTSEDGLAILKSLTTTRATDIVVDESTFSDPTMMVSNEGFAVAARRGLIQQFDIPVVRGGELDGVIYIRDADGVEQATPYVRLSLINANGEMISSTRSEYDGYYIFEKILPGTYQIHVDTSTGRQRGTKPERLKQVKISNRGDLITDIDFVLRQLKSANGYIAKLGEFSSEGLLKVYFKLLSERVDSNLLSEAFYIESKQTNRYLLGAKYIEVQNQEARKDVVKLCQELHLLDVDCEDENVEFEY